MLYATDCITKSRSWLEWYPFSFVSLWATGLLPMFFISNTFATGNIKWVCSVLYSPGFFLKKNMIIKHYPFLIIVLFLLCVLCSCVCAFYVIWIRFSVTGNIEMLAKHLAVRESSFANKMISREKAMWNIETVDQGLFIWVSNLSTQYDTTTYTWKYGFSAFASLANGDRKVRERGVRKIFIW